MAISQKQILTILGIGALALAVLWVTSPTVRAQFSQFGQPLAALDPLVSYKIC